MPIVLKHKDLLNPQFKNALDKVVNSGAIKDVREAYNVARLVSKCDAVCRSVKSDYQALVNKWAVHDESFNVKTPDGSLPGSFEVADENLAEWEKAVDELSMVEFTVERHPVPLSQLQGVGLSPAELVALEPILASEA